MGELSRSKDVKVKHLSCSDALMPQAGVPAFPGSERQVEFVGPPGVGKSAIYHAVYARLGRRHGYRTVQEGRLLAAVANLDRVSPLQRIPYRSAFRLPRIGSVYARRLAVMSTEHSFRHTLRGQGDFLECCIELARTGFGDAFARFARLPILLEHLRDLHLWNSLPGRVQILQQDALVQKGWICARQLREAYFSSVPKPGALVVVSARPEVIVERLRGRERQINAHIDLTASELHAATVNAAEAFQLATDLLRARGVPVLEVDGEADLADAAGQVAEFLQNRVVREIS